MTNVLSHRGPDRGDVWVDSLEGIALGHRRLSIIDLTSCGNQPMLSQDGRFRITYNGEIYNHLQLREELGSTGSSPEWRGHSDTETLLECISAWGLEETLKRAVGMFAFGVWDHKEKLLHLARDRFGEKPLYYGFVDGFFGFASELQALIPLSKGGMTVNREALALYMSYGYVPDPHSIYEGVQKLTPGCFITVPHSPSFPSALVEPQPYWSLADSAEQGQISSHTGMTDSQALDGLDDVLTQAIKSQQIADVPIGAFLSGGIDSSLVVALMQKVSTDPVNTFSIGFNEPEYDEAVYAKKVANSLGTNHTELYVSEQDALEVVPKLPRIYSEPFADSSQIPTYLVSALAKEKVSVSLSGDGGDELFGGYTRYFVGADRWPTIEKTPRIFRQSVAAAIRLFPEDAWDKVLNPFLQLVPARARPSFPGGKLHKVADSISAANSWEMYTLLASQPTQALVVAEPQTPTIPKEWGRLASLQNRMMLIDAMTYLPGDILTKIDRSAMAHSLETRVPFLDHRVAEFAWRLPLHQKFRDGKGKWVLRENLARYVPRSLIDRPKMGFGVPLAQWLRGPLREWASELLDSSKIRDQGFLNADVVSKKWQEHVHEGKNWHFLLWNILMFQAWLEQKASDGHRPR